MPALSPTKISLIVESASSISARFASATLFKCATTSGSRRVNFIVSIKASRSEAMVSSSTRKADVAEILDGLMAEHREVLVLHDVEGYTHQEIADALGIEVGTSKSRLSRARAAFRERWLGSPSEGVPQ